jgi:hypothetical protein
MCLQLVNVNANKAVMLAEREFVASSRFTLSQIISQAYVDVIISLRTLTLWEIGLWNLICSSKYVNLLAVLKGIIRI